MKNKAFIIATLFISSTGLTTSCENKKADEKFATNVSDGDGKPYHTSNILRTSTRKEKEKSNLTVYDQATVGVKNFDQINATMSRLTGVSKNDVRTLFNSIKSSLPSKNNFSLFTGTGQVGVVKLASEYCSLGLDNQTTRATILGDQVGLYEMNLNTAFSEQNRKLLLDQLASRFWVHRSNYAKGVDIKRFMDELYTELLPLRSGNNRGEAQKVIKATCVLYLSAAPVIIL